MKQDISDFFTVLNVPSAFCIVLYKLGKNIELQVSSSFFLNLRGDDD